MTQLASYLRDNKIKQSVFADSIGLSQTAVSRLASGAMTPSLSVAIKIERETGGAVRPSDWFPASAAEQDRGAA